MKMEAGGESTARADGRDPWRPGGGCSGEGERPPIPIDVVRQDRSFAIRLDVVTGVRLALLPLQKLEELKASALLWMKRLMRMPVLVDGRNVFEAEACRAAEMICRGVGKGDASA